MSIVSLDGLFFIGQWAAFVLAIVSLLVSFTTVRAGGVPAQPLWIPIYAAVLLLYLIFAGVPHQANRGEWSNGELGAAAFVRGEARRRKANAKPVPASPGLFSGTWQSGDGTRYSITATDVSWSGANGNGAYSQANCGARFQMSFVLRDREVLQDLGLPWSIHVNATYDSTAVDAQIPVLDVSCGAADHVVFIRATANEVWRWTNLLVLDDITSNSFVLRRSAN